MTNEISSLITRLESLDGPCQRMDIHIVEMVLGWVPSTIIHDWKKPDGTVTQMVPKFTESIDAALTLVPEGRLWSVGSRVKVSGYVAVMNNSGVSYHGPTPAIAVCIASLKAIQDTTE